MLALHIHSGYVCLFVAVLCCICICAPVERVCVVLLHASECGAGALTSGGIAHYGSTPAILPLLALCFMSS